MSIFGTRVLQFVVAWFHEHSVKYLKKLKWMPFEGMTPSAESISSSFRFSGSHESAHPIESSPAN